MASSNCQGQSIVEFLIITTMITLIFFSISQQFKTMSQTNKTYQLQKPQQPTGDQELNLMDILNDFLKQQGNKK